MRPLEPEELQQLEDFIELTNDARLQTRARMVWLFHKRNHTIQEIADIMNTHEDTVRKWIDRFEERGFDGLKDDSRSGAPRKAGAHYIYALLESVRGVPRSFGFNTHTWTLELLAYHLFQQTGVRICQERVRQLLLAHDFVCRRPKTIVRSPDPQKREKMEKIADILFSPGNYVVLFEDETDLNLNPGIQRCWMPRGEQKEILTPGRNKKVHVFGVVDARRSQVRVRIAKKKNARTFLQFLRQILRAYPGRRIYLVIDNWGMHDAKIVRAFLALHRRLVFVHLPSYAPLLNVIERLWNPAKARLTKNAVWGSIEELREAARRYFRSTAMRIGEAFKVNLREWIEIRKDLLAST